jgi:hypothetical protein
VKSHYLLHTGPGSKLKAGKLRANKFLIQAMNDEANLVYLDKAWQIIHFGLSGEEWDCNDAFGAAIMGGEALGSSETEKLLDQELVSEIAKVLEPIGEAEFKEMLLSRDLEDAELYCFDFFKHTGGGDLGSHSSYHHKGGTPTDPIQIP